MSNFESEDNNVYVVVKNYLLEDEEVVAEVVGWSNMTETVNRLYKRDKENTYEAFVKEYYYNED